LRSSESTDAPPSGPKLDAALWEAANTLRGSAVDRTDWKGYILPLLFFKRISDCWDEETADARETFGDEQLELFPEVHRFVVPEGCHWRDVRETASNVGAALLHAMREIEKANPETLYRVFGTADWGNKDFEDVLAGVDYAIEEGYADPDRLGVGGWSYGGILTNYVITKSDRFEGAITGASKVLYIANYGHDHYQYEWEMELGLPWESREAWERISPFNDVDKVTTPTLVIGGKEDWNVPINNSEQLYQALKRRGIDTQLVVYPEESHGISRPSFIRDRYERYLDWYDRTVQGGD